MIDRDEFSTGNKIKAAKLIKMLTMCGKLQNFMFMRLIKKYESKQIVCTKYFYEIYLKLKKNNNAQQSKENNNAWQSKENNNAQQSKYLLDSVDISFLNNIETEHDATGILRQFNESARSNTLLGKNSKVALKYNLHEPYYSSFLNLINMYSENSLNAKSANAKSANAKPINATPQNAKPQYQYLFLPVIVDYSIDVGLVHQCAIIVDLHNGVFLFYEPYGQYVKYGAEYYSAVKEFLNLYKLPSKYYLSSGELNYHTWHEYFDLPRGIQIILLKMHNEKKNQYEQDKAIFLQHVLEQNSAEHAKLISRIAIDKNLPVHMDDYTFDTLNILDFFTKYQVSNKLEADALYIYYKYNSKTCVTITITELDYFFENICKYKIDQQKIKMQEYYYEFQVRLNDKLFERALEFIYSSPALINILNSPLKSICKEISKY